MSRFSGPQGKGAMKRLRETRRQEAEARQARVVMCKAQADVTAFVAAADAAAKSLDAFKRRWLLTSADAVRGV